MTTRTILLSLTLGALAGCGWEAVDPAVLVPVDVDLAWDGSFNRLDDGVGALVPVDIMVYDAGSGEPLDLVALEVSSEQAGTLVLGSDEVVPVDVDDCFACDVYWDVWQDQYFDLDPAEEEYGESVDVQTDVDGLARVYVYVDAFPIDPADEFASIPVNITTVTTDDSFFLVPR